MGKCLYEKIDFIIELKKFLLALITAGERIGVSAFILGWFVKIFTFNSKIINLNFVNWNKKSSEKVFNRLRPRSPQ